MQHIQRSCGREGALAPEVGRELAEEELATVYGGQDGNSTGSGDPLGGLGGLLSGGMLGNLTNPASAGPTSTAGTASTASATGGISPLANLLKNALPGVNGLSNLTQLLSGLGL